ncbi:hypothetical protein B0H11DRAFT_1944596 [Mycena galericulata]|nr:hypothetical protein B0H11DRAFT_1944596 [Mycena galericulata]
MVCADEQLEKNKQKAAKAKETRQRNLAARSAGSQSPFPPATTDKNSPPQTLAAGAPPRPPLLTAAAVTTTPQPPAPRPSVPQSATATPRRPLISMAPQQTTGSSPAFGQQFPSTSMYPPESASPLMPLQANYQPRYANFGSSSPLVPPQEDVNNFGAMVAGMTTEQFERLAAVLSADTNFGQSGGESNTPAGAQIPEGGGDAGIGESGAAAGDPDPDPDPNLDLETSDREDAAPWNNNIDNDNNEEDSEQQGSDAHGNAKSSLEVTMQDVVVRQKRKRGALTGVEGTTSDSENNNQAVGRPKKKRAGRTQKSRSIKDVDPDRQRIIKATYPFVQKFVTTAIPFPAASPTGDPSADDDDFEAIFDESWTLAVTSLDLDLDDVEQRTDQETNLMRARIPQVRGAIMTAVDALLPGSYGFTKVEDLDDPTPEKIEATSEANRQLVEDLEGTFMYTDPANTMDMATMCRNPIFQKLLNIVFFAKKGINRRSHYFKGDVLLPLETLGLLMDAVICGMDRWKTGQYELVDFDAEHYGRIHEDSMVFLRKWVKEYAEHQVEDLAVELRTQMLTKARGLSNTPAEQPRPRRGMFPMGVFSQ